MAYILGAGDLEWIEIVVIAIIFGASIIGSLFQKAKEKQKEETTRKQRRSGGQQPQPRKQRRAPIPVGRVVQTVPPTPEQNVRVSQELRLQQQRQAQIEQDRKKRMASQIARQSKTPAADSPREIGKVGVILSLDNPVNAKKAMILHEVFSPPKALRKGGEMWEM